MSIPVKLTISTKHTLPTNHNISLYDQMRGAALEAADEVMEEMADLPYPSDEGVFSGSETVSMEVSEDALWDPAKEETFDPEDPDCQEALRQSLEALIDKFFDQENDENTGRFVFTTEAEMEVEPGSIVLSYDEAPGSDLGETKSIIRIDRTNPHALVIQRTGGLMNTLICEKGRRHTSAYSSPMIPMPLEACTYTRRCDIDVDEDGGVIFLDYIIEIRGADVQRTVIRMNIAPLRR